MVPGFEIDGYTCGKGLWAGLCYVMGMKDVLYITLFVGSYNRLLTSELTLANLGLARLVITWRPVLTIIPILRHCYVY